MTEGTQLGPYRLGSLLGKGGMAEVYRAWHDGLQHYHALKILPSHSAADRNMVERFIDEARKMARLQHPNIATVHTVSDADTAQPYFAMELVEDGDLSDLIEHRKSFSLEAALPLLRQIGLALDYAHSQGLIHRDVKPGNVLLKADGSGGYLVKMVDFGIARAREENDGKRLTKTGVIVGTPEYMSPEQSGSGAPVDHRTDIYAFGIIAYEMLCGRPPFQGGSETSMLAVIMQHMQKPPHPPRAYAPQLSEAAEAVILKVLAKNPQDRFDSCGAFLEALTNPQPVKTGPTSTFPLLPAAVGVTVFMGVGLIGFALNRPTDQLPPSSGDLSASVQGSTSPASTGQDQPPPGQPAAEKISVPFLVGKTEANAREILNAKSLSVNVVSGHSSDYKLQQVMSQHPAVGAAVKPGTPITIRISLGPDAAELERLAQIQAARRVETPMVLGTVDRWREAWERQNVDDYMAHYTSDARIRSNKKWYSYSEYYNHERELFSHGGTISIKRQETKVDIRGERAYVSFPMTFQRWGGKGNYKSRGRQSFRMRKENGRWLIEEDVFSK